MTMNVVNELDLSATRIVVPDCSGNLDIETAFRQHLLGVDGVEIFLSSPENVEAHSGRVGRARTMLQFFSAAPVPTRVLNESVLERIVIAGPVGRSVDVEAARARHIAVYEAPGLAADAVAEYTVTLFLALARQLVRSCEDLKAGEWRPRFGRELGGKTIGLVGLGEIGSRVARICQAFSTRVLAWSPGLTEMRAAQCGVQRVDLKELAERSDVVSLHLRESPRTRGIFDAELIGSMRSTAVLVNTARAGLVDGPALRTALEIGKIAGAALDVFESEPIDRTSPWATTRNVILSPHMAWMTHDAVDRFVRAAVSYVVNGDESCVRRVA